MPQPSRWYEPLPIFVYGTLKRGFRNHGRYCFDARDVVPAWTRGRLYHLPAGFPAMVRGSGGRVVGELLTFPDPKLALRRLDALEGFEPGEQVRFYERVTVVAHPVEGADPVQAWTYVFSDEHLERHAPNAELVADGEWELP